MRDLLAHGADVNALSASCLSPLHAAVNFGRVDAMRALLDAGASPWLEDIRGQSPYAIAAASDDPGVLAAITGRALAAEAQGTGVWALASFMNHASEPSIMRRVAGRSMFVYAMRDLAAGDELTTSYSTSKKALAESWGIPDVS